MKTHVEKIRVIIQARVNETDKLNALWSALVDKITNTPGVVIGLTGGAGRPRRLENWDSVGFAADRGLPFVEFEAYEFRVLVNDALWENLPDA